MEYRFELALCAALESPDRVVARQLGAGVATPGTRIVDVCLLRPGPTFDERAAIAADRIPDPAVEAAVGPGEAVPVTDAFDLSPERVNDVVDRAVEVGYLERERRDGRPVVRATARYPDDWVEDLVAVENKPDLGTPGDLEAQLRYDVAIGLFDEVVLTTASYVTRAHLNRIPEAVGVWRFDPETGEREVVREATPLDPVAPGVEIRDERPSRTDVALVDPDAKARKRRRVAERAYGKGWRPDPPPCAHGEPTDDGRPRCAHFDRVVDPGRECGGGCPAFEPADPPDAEGERLRDERTAWVAAPDGGGPRRQSGLSRYL
ncbi:hypothetical protein EKH57_11925 [Halorubrum sp. BOL3-1]|uniref:DUF5787 family protein n=1 Tax=Halorubrum sp. BOL3-1 TaxID=2497325 RepID=UPI001004F4FD|nr:DUF5787 family protein [Halorubrum sp. BOL3-1]QAU13365.1 hypothetical protein EKH57_11925 [Halorubrum sp. BOL3-1]